MKSYSFWHFHRTVLARVVFSARGRKWEGIEEREGNPQLLTNKESLFLLCILFSYFNNSFFTFLSLEIHLSARKVLCLTSSFSLFLKFNCLQQIFSSIECTSFHHNKSWFSSLLNLLSTSTLLTNKRQRIVVLPEVYIYTCFKYHFDVFVSYFLLLFVEWKRGSNSSNCLLFYLAPSCRVTFFNRK